jgi:hypothetical protein
MMTPGPSADIWIAAGHTNMRRGMHWLCALVQTALSQSPFSGPVFCFSRSASFAAGAATLSRSSGSMGTGYVCFSRDWNAVGLCGPRPKMAPLP